MNEAPNIEFRLTYSYEEPPVAYEATVQFSAEQVKDAIGKVKTEVKQLVQQCNKSGISMDKLQYKNIGLSSARESWLKSGASASESIMVSDEDFHKLTSIITDFLSQKRGKDITVRLASFFPIYPNEIDYLDHIPAIMNKARDKANKIAESAGLNTGDPILIREIEVTAREPTLIYGGRYGELDCMGLDLEDDSNEPSEQEPTIEFVKSCRNINVSYKFVFPIDR